MKRRGRPIDVNRIGEATSRPGNDPRVWLAAARVLEDDEPVRWDSSLGLVVDVVIVGGPLDGEGPIPARVPVSFLADSAFVSHPIAPGSFVVLSIVGGDLNDLPSIVGMLFADGAAPPATVNGREVGAELVASAHLMKTPHALEIETSSSARLGAESITLESDSVKLSSSSAGQAFVRGGSFADALATFLDALQQGATALVPPGPTTTPVTQANATAFVTAITAAVQALKNARTGYLSTRIAGE